MARCEDFPCCGHELGCCPAYDEDGRQMYMVCVCGARLPITSRFSICEGCMNAEPQADGSYLPRGRGPDGDDEWIGGYGADEPWDVAYWRKRAEGAEKRLEQPDPD